MLQGSDNNQTKDLFREAHQFMYTLVTHPSSRVPLTSFKFCYPTPSAAQIHFSGSFNSAGICSVATFHCRKLTIDSHNVCCCETPLDDIQSAGSFRPSPRKLTRRTMKGPSPLPGSIQRSQSGAAAKLEHVAEKFQAFYNDLEQEKQQRRLSETTRFQQLQDVIAKLECSIEAEVRRRAEADKKIQSHFDNEVRRLQDRVCLQVNEWQESMKSSIEGLGREVQDVQRIVKEEREERIGEMEQLSARTLSKVDECSASIDDERVARLEREAHTLKRVGEDIFRVQEKIDEESTNRETEVSKLRSELQDTLGVRNTSESKFQAVVLEEMNQLKAKIQAETEARVAEDEEIVNAVNDYTRALQDGLRIVSQT